MTEVGDGMAEIERQNTHCHPSAQIGDKILASAEDEFSPLHLQFQYLNQ